PSEAFRNGPFFCFPFFAIGFEWARRRRNGMPGVKPCDRRLMAAAFAALALLMLEAVILHRVDHIASSMEIYGTVYLAAPLLFFWLSTCKAQLPLAAHAGVLSSLVYFSHMGLLVVFGRF